MKETTIRRIYYWWLIPLVIHPLILQRYLKKKGRCEGGNYSEDILLVAHPISNSFTDRLLHNIHVNKPLSAFTLKGWSWKWLKEIPIIGSTTTTWWDYNYNIHVLVDKPLSAFTLKGWSWKWFKQILIIGMGNVLLRPTCWDYKYNIHAKVH